MSRISIGSTAKKIGFLGILSMSLCVAGMAQDNSPYSRYGIGDLVPNTNVNSRAMGGVSAAVIDPLSVNANNPATYSLFQAYKELKSSRLVSGRALLDVGINIESRSIREGNSPQKFRSNNALFSHLQIGIPLRRNWGLAFGIRPISRISYKISKEEALKNPTTGTFIDTAYTQYTGEGGANLANIGTGFRVFTIKNKKTNLESTSFNVGANVGYLFGKKNYSTRRSLYNPIITYNSGNFESSTNYGDVYFNVGAFLRTTLNAKRATYLQIGAYGNWAQDLKAKQDIIKETFSYDETNGNVRVDSVSDFRDLKGTLTMPSSYTVGFSLERYPLMEKDLQQFGYVISADLTRRNWDEYRFYGATDLVESNWEFRAGAELRPVPRRTYFSNMTYRIGFFTGPDYIQVQSAKLKQTGFTAGLALPISSNYAIRQGQISYLNLALEYIKRGGKENIVNENLFRLSVGLSFSDLWFRKRKYD